MDPMNVAAIDIGTNSVRLLITDEAGVERVRLMRITRLGQGVDQKGVLQTDAIARTLDVLEAYGEALAAHKVARVRVTATSAARDASNRQSFFDAVQRSLGYAPELLSGDEEALLSFRGATSGLAGAHAAPYLVVDIGGGSTEFCFGTREPEQAISLNVGCVRLTERHLSGDPPTPEQLQACYDDVNVALQQVRDTVDVSRAQTVVGLAGTVTSLAHMQLGLREYSPEQTHHSLLSADQVFTMAQRLSTATVAERAQLLAEPKRAEVIVGGVIVLNALMRELQVPQILVSEADILDGLAASLR